MICLGISSLGTILFVLGYGQTIMSVAAIFLIGLGFGAIYPTGMAMLTSAHPDNPGQAGSLITAMGSIGGAIIPWMQGVVMEKTSIRGGTYMVAVLMLLLILSFAVHQRAVKRAKNN
jgi:fucose permease